MSTQHFGMATVVPRSITWLVRLDDWDHFETVVNYNCAMIGGYFNVLIPVVDDNSLPMPYQRFLLDYDPALIVLAPGMSHIEPQLFEEHLSPFAIIPWDAVSQVAELDPWSCGSGMNPNIMASTHHYDDSSKRVLIAVAQEERPHASWRAFVACGDVKPEEPMWQVMDDDIDLDALGHREMFLSKGLKKSIGMHEVGAYVNPHYAYDTEKPAIIPAPDRYRLRDIIAEEHQFPLSGASDILEACCALQHRLSRQSFVGLTASYAGPTKMIGGTSLPDIAVLVSDSFGLEEAVLFWNLRASDIYTVWLSFSEMEDDLEAIAKWLGSDYGGGFYVMGGEVVFSAAKCDLRRLHDIVGRLEKVGVRRLPHCKIVNRDDLISYSYVRPHLVQEQVMIVEDQSRCTFIPRMPANSTTGVYVVLLDWQLLMLPPDRKLVSLISQDTIGRSLPKWIEGHSVRLLVYQDGISIPRFRINCSHSLEVQVESEAPISFTKPSLAQIVEVLFKAGGFSRIVQSSTLATYHFQE